MNDIPLGDLFAVLAVLILLSAFFSAAETGLLMLNRYRLRHLVKAKHRGAQRAQALLGRTDRLIGLLLLGNNLFNNSAAVIAGIIGLNLFGHPGPPLATALFSLTRPIFAQEQQAVEPVVAFQQGLTVLRPGGFGFHQLAKRVAVEQGKPGFCGGEKRRQENQDGQHGEQIA